MSSPDRLHDGSITSPVGFSAGSASAGMHPDGAHDVALLLSETACSGAGVFTQNRIRAAPVVYDDALLAERPGRLRGIVMNSQIANACTGDEGGEAAAAMARAAETALGLPSRCMLVLSTGVIGTPIPIEDVSNAIRGATETMDPEGGIAAAKAIMTTDRTAKHVAVRVETPAGVVTIGGVAKGSTMIHPNMATMLGVITTDAAMDAARLSALLGQVADRTFNAITVDGDTSPNDSVIMLANGASEVSIVRDAEGWKLFEAAVELVARDLALMIVRDGQGAHRLVEFTVNGAGTEAMARSIGRAIASSVLVKTGWAGGDSDWGSIFSAAGASGFAVEPDRLRLQVQVRADTGGPEGEWLLLAERGAGVQVDPLETRRIFSAPAVAFRLDLGMGGGEATIWTCDLTEEYIRSNEGGHHAKGGRGTGRGRH